MNAYTIGNKLGKNLSFTILGAAIIAGLIGWNAVREKPVEAPRVISAEEKAKSDQYDFSRQAMLTILTAAKDSSVNPSAVQTKNHDYRSNGACMDVNLPNTYGGYDGFKQLCILKIDGVKRFTVNGVIQ